MISISSPQSSGRNRANTVSVIGDNQLLSSKRFIKFDRYKTELCIYKSEIGECPYGDQCCFAHGIDEIRPRPLHDCKERTQPCESFSKDVCYRGSSRCWYLHPKPEFNLDRLRNDLQHWLFDHQKFQPNLFIENSYDWFDDEWNPIFHDPIEYQSIIDQPFTDEDVVDFGDHELNEYFDFHRNYYSLFKEILKSICMIEKKSETNITQRQQVMMFDDDRSIDNNPTYYNWSKANTTVPDHIIRHSFYSIPSSHSSTVHRFCDKEPASSTTIKNPNFNNENDQLINSNGSTPMIGDELLLSEISRLNLN